MPFMNKGYDFNSYAAGNKVYGAGRSNPTSGPVDKMGYRNRDLVAKTRRNMLLRRLKAGQKKRFMSSEYLGGPQWR